jgi:prophage regulatory protein
MAHKVLRLPKVIDITGVPRSGIYARMADGKFPKSIRLGARAVGWIESEVDEWILDRIKQSRKTAEEPSHGQESR